MTMFDLKGFLVNLVVSGELLIKNVGMIISIEMTRSKEILMFNGRFDAEHLGSKKM